METVESLKNKNLGDSLGVTKVINANEQTNYILKLVSDGKSAQKSELKNMVFMIIAAAILAYFAFQGVWPTLLFSFLVYAVYGCKNAVSSEVRNIELHRAIAFFDGDTEELENLHLRIKIGS